MKNRILFFALLLSLVLTASYAGQSKAEASRMTVMPNLMPVLMKFQDELGLTELQRNKLAMWRSINRPKIKQLREEMASLQKGIHDQALEGITREDIMDDLHLIVENWKLIIDIKHRCRANVKHLLSDDQWNLLLHLYHARRQVKDEHP